MKFRLVTIFLVSLFLPIVLADGEKWSGTDDQAEKVIDELTGREYKPWFEPIWEPPSGEIESLLFTIQAAIGAIIIGYFIGYHKGKNAAG